jgi:hypothetical protein
MRRRRRNAIHARIAPVRSRDAAGAPVPARVLRRDQCVGSGLDAGEVCSGLELVSAVGLGESAVRPADRFVSAAAEMAAQDRAWARRVERRRRRAQMVPLRRRAAVRSCHLSRAAPVSRIAFRWAIRVCATLSCRPRTYVAIS